MRTKRVLVVVVAAVLLPVVLLTVSPAVAARSASLFPAPPRAGIITDPAGPAGTTSMNVPYLLGEAATDVTWQLVDGSDMVALEHSLGSAAAGVGQFVLDPTAANGGAALPDGEYELRLKVTDGSGTFYSSSVELTLAFAPAKAAASVLSQESRDVRNSVHANLRSAAVLVVAGDPKVGLGSPLPGGVFEIRNSAGRLVRTLTVGRSCTPGSDGIHCIPDEHPFDSAVYDWTWDGRTAGGTMLPAGRYQLTAHLPDRFGRIVTTGLGSIWIDHLKTFTETSTWRPSRYLDPFRTVVGRCSRAISPGPHGWFRSLGLLSEVRCRSTAGTADRVFQTVRLRGGPTQPYFERYVAQRLDAYGAPARRGSFATVGLFVTPDGFGGRIVFRRTAVLGSGLGWHIGSSVPAAGLGDWGAWAAQVRVSNDNRYDVKYLRTIRTYRAWVR